VVVFMTLLRGTAPLRAVRGDHPVDELDDVLGECGAVDRQVGVLGLEPRGAVVAPQVAGDLVSFCRAEGLADSPAGGRNRQAECPPCPKLRSGSQSRPRPTRPVGGSPRRPSRQAPGDRAPSFAAAVVTWVSSAITVLGIVSLMVFVLWLGGPILDSFAVWGGWVLVWGAGLAVWSVAACLLAHWALEGRNSARLLLATSAGATILASVSVFWLGLPLVSLFGAIAVLVLLFIGGANEWYRNQKVERIQS